MLPYFFYPFSGLIATMPEMHRMVATLYASRVERKVRDSKELLEDLKSKGEHVLDLTEEGGEDFTKLPLKFGDYRAFVEVNTYVGAGGNVVSYPAVTLTKLKPKEMRAKSRYSNSDYFTARFPARRIKQFLTAAEVREKIFFGSLFSFFLALELKLFFVL